MAPLRMGIDSIFVSPFSREAMTRTRPKCYKAIPASARIAVSHAVL
jgi:hypothetical protein